MIAAAATILYKVLLFLFIPISTALLCYYATWPPLYYVCTDLINVRSLQAIESSSMIVCIDRPMLNKEEEEEENGQGASVVNNSSSKDVDSSRALQMIHGCGSDWNSANRWFDKTVQVYKNTYNSLSSV